ncbi:hypothetical protein [Pseudoxanthomonas suwonensis]|uniref:hypothetical protein n=1 Tax=Pseudoxanthomonas suwonensis TaxID=314722 RepID=UPI0004BB100E|nr:hypothetical protein [Pseudoxanthomonas suwonensis]
MPFALSRHALRVLLLLLPVLPLLAACGGATAEATAAAVPQAATDVDLVARGEYLVRIAGCNDCHTPGYGEAQGEVPKEQWLVGSAPLGYTGPWGTTYATNLRLRMQELTEAQWLEYSAHLRARPLMPDFNLRAMTEEDRRALYRFIRDLGPAGEKAPPALPPGQTAPPPVLALVMPEAPAGATAAAGAEAD